MNNNIKKYFFLMMSVFLPIATFAFDNFDCVGSKPVWNLSLTKLNFIFKMDSSTIKMPAVEPTTAENMDIEHIRIYRTKIAEKDAIIILQKQSCSDNKSEEVFSYEGLLITPDKVFHGCCSKKLILTE